MNQAFNITEVGGVRRRGRYPCKDIQGSAGGVTGTRPIPGPSRMVEPWAGELHGLLDDNKRDGGLMQACTSGKTDVDG